MYNASLRACRVKWGTSSATRYLTGQQQSKTMASGKLCKYRKDARCAHSARRSPYQHHKGPISAIPSSIPPTPPCRIEQ